MTKQQSNPWHWWNEGEAYFVASLILTGKATKHPDVFLGYPVGMCAAYAAELFLKALVVVDGREPERGHNLATRFEGLPEAHRNGIARLTQGLSADDLDNELRKMPAPYVTGRYSAQRIAGTGTHDVEPDGMFQLALGLYLYLPSLLTDWDGPPPGSGQWVVGQEGSPR